MVLRAQWPLGTIAQFFHFVAEEKKKDKKTKAFYDWATTGIPVKICQALNANSVILARKFNKSKSKFWHHVIALPRKIPKIYLQVFFSFSFHQIEDLRCSSCVSHGTKICKFSPWPCDLILTNILDLRYFCRHNPFFYYLNLVSCHY